MSREKEIYKERLRKLKELKGGGINPYPTKFSKKNSVSEILKKYSKLKKSQTSKAKVSLAGRLLTKREFGKINFAHLQDETGKIQIVVSENNLGKEKTKFFIKKIDAGDIFGIEGNPGKTKTGEFSIIAQKITLLTKSLLPLPEKWHGLKDKEERYRKRYLDLITNQETKEVFIKRCEFIKNIREFLDNLGFLEVETPVLELKTGGAEANPFITHHNILDINMYLRISLELHLKRLMIGGYEKIYELAKVFRNEGMSREHLQEFTMLEFYWAWHNYDDLMKLTEKMLREITKKTFGTLKIKYKNKTLDFSKKFPRYDYVSLIKKEIGIDLLKENTKEKLVKAIKSKKLDKEIDLNVGLGKITDQLYKKYTRPKLIRPCFLINHPVSVSPLAKRMKKNPFLTERFQVLVAGTEIINGFSELNDPIDQEERFKEQQKLRDAGDKEAQMMDEDFIKALRYGMPPTAGFGLGVDRFFSILTNSESIRDVVFFPIMKPE